MNCSNISKERDNIFEHMATLTREAFTDDLPQKGHVLFPTYGGEYITVSTDSRSKVSVTSSVADARIVKSDVSAANGVIHIIDNVL
jgi:uncharacterized surface protein with fasciclin (FAS1) repeats